MAFLVPIIGTAMGASAGTIATMSSVASGLSTAMGIVGTLAQAKSAADAANANAKLAKGQARQASMVANQNEEAKRRENYIEMGRNRASIGQTGTGFGGSNYDIERQNEIFQELDALNIRYEGNVQRQGLLAQASQYKAEASSAWTRGLFGAAGQLFGSFGNYGGTASAPASTTGFYPSRVGSRGIG